MQTEQFHALARFGLGRRGNEALPGDPRAWLAAQLAGADPGPDGASKAETALAAIARQQLEKTPEAIAAARALYRGETIRLLDHAVASQTPFRERLVWFWANHFTISARMPGCAPLVGAYVAEAIRPHVTGRFADMLRAVMRHPAMLIYLDNAQSIGPASQAGQVSRRGLNENLARECLELHTISPAGGYTQADVTALARLLTGWSVRVQQEPRGFLFRPRAHEPGGATVMGQRFADGEAGGLTALDFLATHPATYRHLATKLARHFVADSPPPEAVRRIESVLRDTDGDLGAASRAIIELPQAWEPAGKLRSPLDFVLASLRALSLGPDRRPDLISVMAGLGQIPFNAPLPNGWPDTASGWTGPEALLRRVDAAYALAGRAPDADPLAIAESTLGPLLGAATLDRLRGAPSRREALALLLASPEFQRR